MKCKISKIVRAASPILALILLSGCASSHLNDVSDSVRDMPLMESRTETVSPGPSAEVGLYVSEVSAAVSEPEVENDALREIFTAWLLKNAAEYCSDAWRWEITTRSDGAVILHCYGLNQTLQTFICEDGEVSWGTSGVVPETDAENSTTVLTDPTTGLKMEVLTRYQNDVSSVGAVFQFVEPISKECGYGGDVWQIRQYSVKGFCETFELGSDQWLQSLPGAEEYMLAKDGSYVYVLQRPGDVRHDPENESSREFYQAHLDASRAMLESFISLNGLEKNPYFDQFCP